MSSMKTTLSSYEGVATLEVLQAARRYNRWIAEQIERKVILPVLEIGAGTGNISEHFLHHKNYYISEKDAGLVRQLTHRFAKEKNVMVLQLDITKEIPEHLQAKFGSVFAINVLEHIQDDGKALSHISQLLQKNGKVILLVPAKRFAYTLLDKKLGHHRRYEKEDLRSLVEKNGFKIEELYFFNAVGLISWVGRSILERSGNLRSYQVTLFDKLVPVLKRVESHLQLPFGISLVIIAAKK